MRRSTFPSMPCCSAAGPTSKALTFGPWPYAGKPPWVFSRRRLDTRADVAVTKQTPADVAANIAARGINVGRVQRVAAKNLPALALYSRFGFVECGRSVKGPERIEIVGLRLLRGEPGRTFGAATVRLTGS